MVARVKHTQPPPQICSSCWWRHRHAEAMTSTRDLRRELIQRRVRKVPVRGRTRDPDVVDLVDEIRRQRGDDE